MIKNIHIEPMENDLQKICFRPTDNAVTLDGLMHKIFTEVKKSGDIAVKNFTKQYDKSDRQELRLTPSEIKAAEAKVADSLKSAIKLAYDNILKFHTAQLPQDLEVETMPGVTCYQKSLPIDSIGLYIPGGTAPLFSTVLMLAIPAKVAGCKQIQLCSPPDEKGNLHPAILYTANLCGIKNIFAVGGAQAIAAMSIGTETISKVSKIFGPGNQYVTAAKNYASNYHTAMDMPAGPSELLVYADDTAIPAYVAADLLSQAEHGADSQVVLVAKSKAMVEKVNQEIERQLPTLARANYATTSIGNSLAVVIESTQSAWKYINQYAPEHLIIASDDPEIYRPLVVNAGSVFLGSYCPESAGDYASGTNHTLPTDGWAKSSSGLGVDSFMKKTTFQKISREGLRELGPSVISMAEAEGLTAHANAISIRLNKTT